MMKTIKISKKETPRFSDDSLPDFCEWFYLSTHNLKIQNWHLQETVQRLSLQVWATSLRIIESSSIFSFFLHSEVIFYCIYVPHFHYPSSVDDHLSYVFFLFIADRVTVSMEESVSLQQNIESFGYMPTSGTERSTFSFLRNPHIDFHSSCTRLLIHHQLQMFPFLHIFI